jgi:hypothetical protein
MDPESSGWEVIEPGFGRYADILALSVAMGRRNVCVTMPEGRNWRSATLSSQGNTILRGKPADCCFDGR